MAVTLSAMVDALVAAVARANPALKPDRLVLADGAAPWSLTHRAYRLELASLSPMDWYRSAPGTIVRVSEDAILHVLHAVGGDQSATRLLARRDAQLVLVGLLADEVIAALGIELEVGVIEFSATGDSLSTEIALTLGYDLAIDADEVTL